MNVYEVSFKEDGDSGSYTRKITIDYMYRVASNQEALDAILGKLRDQEVGIDNPEYEAKLEIAEWRGTEGELTFYNAERYWLRTKPAADSFELYAKPMDSGEDW